MPSMPWHGAHRAKGAPVAARIMCYTSISLVTVTLFARCFLKISTLSSSDLTDIKFIVLLIALYHC